MVSKNDILVGVLVLIAGLVIWAFSPAGPAYQDPKIVGLGGHNMTHFLGGGLAIIFGLVGLAMYKKVNVVTRAVSVLSIVVGLVFLLFYGGGPLFSVMQPHGTAMTSVGLLVSLLGIIGIAGSAAMKPKK